MSIAVLAADAAESGSTGEQVAFWITATLIVIGALGLVLSRKTVHGALFVALTMISLAVQYVLNGAPFLGMVQVIVYTGAVMMMFLFVLMLVGVDSSDSLVETLKGQRTAAVLMVLGFGGILVITVGVALTGAPVIGLDEANAAYGGNVQGLAELMFTTYLLPMEVVAALLITAAVGALVLAHRERLEPKLDQPTRSRMRVEAFGRGEHPGPLPNPGVLASSNAIGTPGLLPDGSPSELSIPGPIRGKPGPEILTDPDAIRAERAEIEEIASSRPVERPDELRDVSGHVDLGDVYPASYGDGTAGVSGTGPEAGTDSGDDNGDDKNDRDGGGA